VHVNFLPNMFHHSFRFRVKNSTLNLHKAALPHACILCVQAWVQKLILIAVDIHGLENTQKYCEIGNVIGSYFRASCADYDFRSCSGIPHTWKQAVRLNPWLQSQQQRYHCSGCFNNIFMWRCHWKQLYWRKTKKV